MEGVDSEGVKPEPEAASASVEQSDEIPPESDSPVNSSVDPDAPPETEPDTPSEIDPEPRSNSEPDVKVPMETKVEPIVSGAMTLTVKCDLDLDEIFGRVHVQADRSKTLDWVLNEFCAEKKVRRKRTFALRDGDGNVLSLSSTLADCGLEDGSLVYAFNTDPPAPKIVENPPVKPVYWKIAILALFLAIITFIVAVALWITGMAEWKHIVVVDVSSYSSEVRTYVWPRRGEPQFAALSLVEPTCRTKIGVFHNVSDPEDVTENIIDCLQDTPSKVIPDWERSSTHLYLGGTAALRVLGLERPPLKRKMVHYLNTALSQQGYAFVADSVKVLSGTVESLNIWISINYLMGIFGKLENRRFLPRLNIRPNMTFGSLQMDDLSTQIAFVPHWNENELLSRGVPTTSVTVYNQTHRLFAQSHLCYSLNQLRMRQVAMLLQNTNFTQDYVINNPCLVPGAVVAYRVQDIASSPCVTGMLAKLAFGHEIQFPQGNASYRFVGQGEVPICQRDYISTFFSAPEFNTTVRPPVAGKFIASSQFYTLFQNFRKSRNDVNISLANFNTSVRRLCSSPKDIVFVDTVDLKEWNCFDALYFMQLLTSYGFTEDNWENIQFIEKLNGSSLSWTLGYAIQQTGEQSMDYPKHFNRYFTINTLYWIIGGVFLSLFVVGMCLTVAHLRDKSVQNKKATTSRYGQRRSMRPGGSAR